MTLSINPNNYPTPEERYTAKKAARNAEAEERWNRPAGQLPYPEAEEPAPTGRVGIGLQTKSQVDKLYGPAKGWRPNWRAIRRGAFAGAVLAVVVFVVQLLALIRPH